MPASAAHHGAKTIAQVVYLFGPEKRRSILKAIMHSGELSFALHFASVTHALCDAT
jgi:hypothetical protein